VFRKKLVKGFGEKWGVEKGGRDLRNKKGLKFSTVENFRPFLR
jgi:hypothetical protein